MATVTHELRTPLTSIRAVSEILLDSPGVDLEQRERFLGIIVKEAERLTRLINQTLDMAKIESGHAEWHTSEVELREVVAEAVDATSQLFRDKGVALAVEAERPLPRITADRDRVMQVLINLLSNAVKFSPAAAGRVEVRASTAGGEVRVDVADNGPGIAPDEHDAIFVPFKRSGATGQPGSGLGLAISRRIVEHLGGRLWVESAPGLGSTFCLTLPIQAPAAAREAGAARAAGSG
jgi:signal transduction histidine kinase